MNVGEKIKQYRLKRGLSQEKLSKEILVSRQTISNWENNKTIPELESLVLISKVFDISLDDLLSEKIEDIKNHHNERHYSYYFIIFIISLFILCFFSIILAVKVSKIFLSLPFISVILMIVSTFIFLNRQPSNHSFFKPISFGKLLLLILLVSMLSFFSVYIILSLL